jgi:hypothetical protein
MAVTANGQDLLANFMITSEWAMAEKGVIDNTLGCTDGCRVAGTGEIHESTDGEHEDRGEGDDNESHLVDGTDIAREVAPEAVCPRDFFEELVL